MKAALKLLYIFVNSFIDSKLTNGSVNLNSEADLTLPSNWKKTNVSCINWNFQWMLVNCVGSTFPAKFLTK